ncbi:hypothetical protein FB451DRAFT_1169338 [Mycena latifolia]|nr:hypothetical protein FB451DRAFT_1169338 [Mycena latifolia]
MVAWHQMPLEGVEPSTLCEDLGLFTMATYLTSSAIAFGISTEFALYLVAVLNFSAGFERVILGILGDYFGNCGWSQSGSNLTERRTDECHDRDGIYLWSYDFAWPFCKTIPTITVTSILYGQNCLHYFSPGVGPSSVKWAASRTSGTWGDKHPSGSRHSRGGVFLERTALSYTALGYFAGSALLVASALMLLVQLVPCLNHYLNHCAYLLLALAWGGLAAAVSLRRQGHRVEIFETSSLNKEIGAAIGVQTNAQRVLEYFGYTQENLKGVESLGSVGFSSLGGEGRTTVTNNITGRTSWLCHRSDLHDELKRLAIGEEGTGPPAQLHLGKEVVSCDPVEGTLTLKNGEVHRGDLIIGSDGIHDMYRRHYPRASTFHFLFDTAKLKGLSDMEWFSEGLTGTRVRSHLAVQIYTKQLTGILQIVLSLEQRYHMLFLSSCRHGNIVNVVALHADDRDQDKYDWSAPASVDEVLEEFKGFHPRYLKLLELADLPILRWQLRALPLLPTWINGRTALLGGAAHATLPTLGQGAGMALEDAATIGCLIPIDTTRADIPARLAAYQELRKPRGKFVNRESLEQATQPSKRGLYARSGVAKEQQAFLGSYDAVEATKKYYQDHFRSS